MDECPFNPDHKGKDAAVWEDENGKLCAHCFHNSCTGKGWKEFRAAISGSDKLTQFRPGEKNSKEEKEPTQAEQLIIMANGMELFHDQNKVAFTFLENEVVPLRAKKIKLWLSRQFYQEQEKDKAPNSDAINQALYVLEGRANFDGPQITLHNRIAKVDDRFFYDLGNGKVVETSKDGWKIIDAPILFRRYSHQHSQVLPTKGGDPRKIFNFLNVAEENKLLVLVYLVCCFVPDIPHPIVHPHGPQGSGKTSLFQVFKKLADPSSIEALITPRDSNQLVQVLAHHHMPLFDNLSELPALMSDLLAQACTGGGFSKRELFTDDDDIIYQIKRCIGLNGINLLISRPDLMDRSILLHLERIPDDKRREEKELWGGRSKMKRRIF